MDVAAAFSGAVDRHAREQGGRTDLGEMAQMAAVESLAASVGPALPSLFGPGPADVQRAIGRLAAGDRCSGLAQELAARSLVREQAFGEALEPDKLERLGRYEVHLDRKLERTLSMLFRLKKLRPLGKGS